MLDVESFAATFAANSAAITLGGDVARTVCNYRAFIS